VLLGERHVVVAGVERVKLALQGVALGLGELLQRGQPADRLVAGGEFLEELGCRRAAATDVRVVREDLLLRARRAVRHQHDCRALLVAC